MRMKTLGGLILASLFSGPAICEDNRFALRFFATGHNQQDRARFQLDDDLGGAHPDASRKSDIGAGDFTIEFWIKGILSDNPTGPARAAGDYFDYNWITGNIVIDRDIYGGGAGSDHDFGISLRQGRVEFGTSTGGVDASEHTLVGAINVLDGQWRHVALSRDKATGTKRIFVDAVLDRASAANVSTGDLSYPNEGVVGQVTPCGLGPWGPFLVIGTEKHDADWESNGCNPPENFAFPGFTGRVDEVRLWTTALDQSELMASREVILDPDSPGLAAYWRFEEGAGGGLKDQIPGGTTGVLIQGVPGNGEWTSDSAPVFASPTTVSNWILY